MKTGPPSIQLNKAVIIQIPHCANLKHGFWNLSIFMLCQQNHKDKSQMEWQKIINLGQETINTPIFTQLDVDKIFLMTEFLSSFVLVGESFNGRAVKNLKLAAFAPPFSCVTAKDYFIRIYVFEDTPCALQYCSDFEKRLGGVLMDKPKTLLFQDGGSNLCLTVEEIGLGWKAKPGSSYQEIPFGHVWHCSSNTLHCSFSLEQTESIHHLHCKITASQSNNPSHKQTLTISSNEDSKINSPFGCKKNFIYDDCFMMEELSKNFNRSSPNMDKISEHHEQKNMTVSDKGINTCIVDNVTPFRLSKIVKKQLCSLLDSPSSRGNDWRLLAQQLNVDRYLNFFATKKSPTEYILDLWECRHRNTSAVADLAVVFRNMERIDAANVVENSLGPSWL